MGEKKKRLIFLVRAFNDLDHFTPVMWKTLQQGHHVELIFTDARIDQNYLTKFLKREGIIERNPKYLRWYHSSFRPRLRGSRLCRLLDALLGVLPALVFLGFRRRSSMIVEWGGISGRELARYFLVANRLMMIPTFSLPHGYHIWTNKNINELMVSLGASHKKFDFSERNRFDRVVAQSRNVGQFFQSRGVLKEKLAVIGSPRFCEEWTYKNLDLALAEHPDIGVPADKPFFLVFLGNWQYRMNRAACLGMVNALRKNRSANIVIKGHSRGDLVGGLVPDEREIWLSETIFYANESIPSNVLIHHSRAVINYGSSIGIEAIVQRKPLCNASFITENTTIFDNSGVTWDAQNISNVVEFVERVLNVPEMTTMTEESRTAFLSDHVYAGQSEADVLDSCVNLIA